MGLDPEIDEGLEIQNGGFDDAAHWIVGSDWVIAGGKASFIFTPPAHGVLQQINIPTVVGYPFLLEVTVSNYSFDNPGGEIGVLLGGVNLTPTIQGNGIYQAAAVAVTANSTLVFAPVTLGDPATFDIDNVVGYPLTGYVDTVLGISYPGPQKTEIYPASGADFSQILASRNGKTNVGILYNI